MKWVGQTTAPTAVQKWMEGMRMAKLIDATDIVQKTFVCDEVAEVRKIIESAEGKGRYCVECELCHYNSSNGTFKCKSMKGMNRTVQPYDFCSYGERRDGV